MDQRRLFLLLILLFVAVVLSTNIGTAAPKKTYVTPPPADPAHWSFMLRLPHYVPERARLIRQGYRPVMLQHDDRDWVGDFWKRFPELLACDGGDHLECHFIFERPDHGQGGRKRYVVVRTLGETAEGLGPRVLGKSAPDPTDLKVLWIRRDLADRGCEDDILLHRDCDPQWKRDLWGEQRKRQKAERLATPTMPNLPPLPPGRRL